MYELRVMRLLLFTVYTWLVPRFLMNETDKNEYHSNKLIKVEAKFQSFTVFERQISVTLTAKYKFTQVTPVLSANNTCTPQTTLMHAVT